jgi:hypothetical protein
MKVNLTDDLITGFVAPQLLDGSCPRRWAWKYRVLPRALATTAPSSLPDSSHHRHRVATAIIYKACIRTDQTAAFLLIRVRILLTARDFPGTNLSTAPSYSTDDFSYFGAGKPAYPPYSGDTS